ncbi:hypothetical protein GCM10020331_016660 [Ectobacillus funiculus]
MLGKHNVYNALACMAIAEFFFGVTWEEMKQGLAQLQLTGMRMEVIKTDNGLTVINDAYNASPTSMRAALLLMDELQGFFLIKLLFLVICWNLVIKRWSFTMKLAKALTPLVLITYLRMVI